MTIEQTNEQIQIQARTNFKRLILYTCIAGVVMVGLVLTYLGSQGPLNPTIIIATTLGVFFSVLLGAGLMAMGFLSSSSGHDDAAAAATDHSALAHDAKTPSA